LKRLLAMGAVLALVGVMAAPMAALAETTLITGTVADTPTIESVTASSGSPGASPVVTIVGTNFVAAQTTIQVDGTGVTPGGASVSSATELSCTFTLGSAATAGPRNVKVTVAGKQSTTSVAFTVLGVIAVEAPTGGALGYLTAGDTKLATLTAGTVTTNSANWQISAIDLKVTKKGYMTTVPDGSGNSLAAPFQISKTAGSYADASTALVYNQTTDSGKTLPLSISQVVAADAAAGLYQITITFTGSTP
jgi:hypothetical protein